MHHFLDGVSVWPFEPDETHSWRYLRLAIWTWWTTFLVVFQTGNLNQMNHILDGVWDWPREPDESHSYRYFRLSHLNQTNHLLVFQTGHLNQMNHLLMFRTGYLNQMNQFLVRIAGWPPEPDEPVSRWYFRLATRTRWTNFSLVLQAGQRQGAAGQDASGQTPGPEETSQQQPRHSQSYSGHRSHRGPGDVLSHHLMTSSVVYPIGLPCNGDVYPFG